MHRFNKVRSLVSLTAVLCAVVLLNSCDGGTSDEASSTITLVKLGRVYTAGYSTGVIRAFYWVDNTLKTIADAGDGVATKASCVVPTNFGDYVVGTRTDFVDPAFIERAIIWFNGKGEFLDTVSSFAFGAVLHKGKIYVVGWRDPDGSGDRPCVWEVSDTWTLAGGVYTVDSRSIVRHDLDTNGDTGQARDIYTDGSDLYVCGYYTQGITDFACYWKNNARVDLDGGTWAEAICVYEGRIYVGGMSDSNARYWIDGVGYDITGFPSGSSDYTVSAVAAGEGGLFLAGTYYRDNNLGFTWHAGTLTTSLPPVIGAGAMGTDFYLGCQEGWFRNDDYNELPWIGGTVRPRGIKMRLY